MNNIEIERKFLPKVGTLIPFSTAINKSQLSQVYIQGPDNETVCRVRVIDNEKAFMTMKAPSDDNGLSRIELECSIPLEVASSIMISAPRRPITKVRYEIPFGDLTFEVDTFFGANNKLVLIELELPSVSTKVDLPNWVGDEVTSDPRYTNAYMSDKPYNSWA